MKKIIVFVVLVLAMLGGYTLYEYKNELVKRVTTFSGESVEESFKSYATEMQGSKYLQLAKLNQTEMFEKSSSKRILWEKLKLPDVIVYASVPVEYTYFLDLDDIWIISISDNICNVDVPDIKFNRPAADISNMDLGVKKGSLFRDERKVLNEFKGRISELLDKRAVENREIVRELMRKKTSEFILAWLIKIDRYRSVEIVKVSFADEKDMAKVQSLKDN